MVPFAHEFSLLIARDQQGSIAFWDAPENVHKDGILATSTVPAHPKVLEQVPAARALARRIAEKLNYVGVFAIEFFASDEGPVFNEMAPRVHNSGHWTIEGAATSQFENHIRAIAGLPLGDTAATSPSCMINLIGSSGNKNDLLKLPYVHLHMYGKEERVGRKIGHINIHLW